MTDKQKADIMNSMVILIDTREKKNEHILEYFITNHIKYRIEKLDTADYSFILPNNPELGMDRKILVERKGSLDEVCGNLTKNRDRFIREFERVDSEHIHMVIENATWKKILNGSYRSKFEPNAFKANLITLSIRYNCPIWFATTKESGELIHSILHYELREFLKNL